MTWNKPYWFMPICLVVQSSLKPLMAIPPPTPLPHYSPVCPVSVLLPVCCQWCVLSRGQVGHVCWCSPAHWQASRHNAGLYRSWEGCMMGKPPATDAQLTASMACSRIGSRGQHHRRAHACADRPLRLECTALKYWCSIVFFFSGLLGLDSITIWLCARLW